MTYGLPTESPGQIVWKLAGLFCMLQCIWKPVAMYIFVVAPKLHGQSYDLWAPHGVTRTNSLETRRIILYVTMYLETGSNLHIFWWYAP